MAADKNNSGNFPALSQNFISILIFGFFLTLVFFNTFQNLYLSIFLGAIGGLILVSISTSNKNTTRTQYVASSDGIDAGLKFWLFFMLGFVFSGYSTPISILLGGIGGLGGGWIYAWWGSREDTRNQLPVEETENVEEDIVSHRAIKRKRKTTRRIRRRKGSQFWQK